MALIDVGQALWMAVLLVALSIIIFLVPYFGLRIGFDRLFRTRIQSRTKKIVVAGLASGLPLGFTGLVAGYLTGLSRAP
jgi:hypothetical protein